MSVLHIFKTRPDDHTQTLMSALAGSAGEDTTVFDLFDEQADYEKLIDLIFENEKVITWW